MDDLEPVVAPLESYVELYEDEVEKLNFEVGLLVSSIDDDNFQEEEQHINRVELDEQKTLSLPIPLVVQEHFDQILLQQREEILVQSKYNLCYNFTIIPHSDFVLQGDPRIDYCLDVKLSHHPVELMLKHVFQPENLKSLGTYTFLLINVEV